MLFLISAELEYIKNSFSCTCVNFCGARCANKSILGLLQGCAGESDCL